MQEELSPEQRRQKQLRLYYVNNRLMDLRKELSKFQEERLNLMIELGLQTTTMKD